MNQQETGLPTDPSAHRRRPEPYKQNVDPSCPGANIRKGDSLTNWDIVHKDKFRSYYSMTKERHEEIFGK